MNRPIKFRAWGGSETHPKYFIHFGLDGVRDDYIEDQDGCCDGPGDFILSKGNVIAVQQFTGLIDKNRKEIYEGDVLALREFPNRKGNAVVVFDEGEFTSMRDDNILGIRSDDAVIGNIYENSDLIR